MFAYESYIWSLKILMQMDQKDKKCMKNDQSVT